MHTLTVDEAGLGSFCMVVAFAGFGPLPPGSDERRLAVDTAAGTCADEVSGHEFVVHGNMCFGATACGEGKGCVCVCVCVCVRARISSAKAEVCGKEHLGNGCGDNESQAFWPAL